MLSLFVTLCALASTRAQDLVWHHFGINEYLLDGQRSVHSYNDASHKCAEWDATLAVIKTAEVHQFISNLSRFATVTEMPYSYYIGMFRTPRDSKLRWLDVSDVSVGFTKWATGEPRQGTGLNAVVMGRRDAKEDELNWRVTDGQYDALSHARVACRRPSRAPREPPPIFPLHEEEVITTTTRRVATLSSPGLVELEVQANRFTNLRRPRPPVQVPEASGGGTTTAFIVIAVIIAIAIVVLMYVWFLRWKKAAANSGDEEEAFEDSGDEEEPNVAPDSSQPQTSSTKDAPGIHKPAKPAASSSLFLQARSNMIVVTNSVMRRFSAISTYFDARSAQSNTATKKKQNSGKKKWKL